jgi:hypothetical protein
METTVPLRLRFAHAAGLVKNTMRVAQQAVEAIHR